MPFHQSGLTKSLAIWISFLILIAPHARAGKTLSAGEALSCAPGYRSLAALGRAEVERVPIFGRLRRDLPEIKDPIAYVREFEKRRADWNRLNPADRNEFPMPEMDQGVRQLVVSLRKIKRPPENRLVSQTFLRELETLKAKQFPYRDTLLKIHEALNLVALKHPLTIEEAKALAKTPGARTAREKIDVEKFLGGSNASLRAEFEKMMETEIFFPTARPQTVEGLAESFVLGLRPLQIAERSARLDGLNMTGLHRFEHDVAHIVIQEKDPVNRSIATLPFEARVAIIRDIESLSTARQQSLARFSLYQTAHEWGNDSSIPRSFNRDAVEEVQAEYRNSMHGEMTADEVHWLQDWYRNQVGRRVFEASQPRP